MKEPAPSFSGGGLDRARSRPTDYPTAAVTMVYLSGCVAVTSDFALATVGKVGPTTSPNGSRAEVGRGSYLGDTGQQLENGCAWQGDEGLLSGVKPA